MRSLLGYIGATLSLIFPQVAGAAPPGSQEAETVRRTRAPMSADRFLRNIYAHYSVRHAPDRPAVESPWQRAASIFTPGTAAVIEEHRKLLTEIGVIDGDPFCDCQDWLRLEVDRVSIRAAGPNDAHAIVQFHDKGEATKEVAFRLLRLNGGWRVEDMTLLGASPDGWLVATLKAETAELHENAAAEQR